MKIIKILFTSPNSIKIGAEAIKIYQGFTCYSHVAVELPDQRIYHAAHGSVHFITMDELLKNNKICHAHEIVLTEEQFTIFMLNTDKFKGIPYGYDELLKIVISDIIWNITGYRESFLNGKGFICSELILTLFSGVIDIKFKKPNHLVTPKDVFQLTEGLAN